MPSFYLFQGNSCSSDFETRLGFVQKFEVTGWSDLLVQFVNYRLESFEWEALDEEEGLDGYRGKLPFVQLLFQHATEDVPRTEEGMVIMANRIKNWSISESTAKTILDSLEQEKGEPMIFVERNSFTQKLLAYLGAEDVEDDEDDE